MYPTTLSSWVLLIYKGLETYGIDSEPLFEQAGLDYTKLTDSNARYPVQNLQTLWNLAAEASGDRCFGLRCAMQWHPTTMYALGYAWLASGSLMEALNRLSRYGRIVNNAASSDLEEVDGTMELTIRPDKGVESQITVSPIAQDATMATLVHISRMIYGEEFNPVSIELTRPEPECLEEYMRYFQCPITFNGTKWQMTFDKEVLLTPLPTANAELAHMNEKVVLDYLTRLDKDNLPMQVKKRLVDNLSHGEITEELMAKWLNMSARTLQRKLNAMGTSYKKLLDETRKELALTFVKDSRRSMSEITFLLGFSEQSNFTRAFRRWQGVSPTEFRLAG
jgi:AraC-like DNA-binding protein